MKRAILSFVAFFLSINCYADDWVEIYFTGDRVAYAQAEVLLDESSVKQFWITEINIDKSLPYDTNLSQVEIDCQKRKMRINNYALYLRGKLVENELYDSQWFSIPPYSAASKTYEVACQKRKSNINTFNSMEAMRDSLQAEMRAIKEREASKKK